MIIHGKKNSSHGLLMVNIDTDWYYDIKGGI